MCSNPVRMITVMALAVIGGVICSGLMPIASEYEGKGVVVPMLNPDDTIKVEPIRAKFFPTAKKTINSWIHASGGPDMHKIRKHGWDIWAALNEPSSQKVDGQLLPIWETWYSRYEVFEHGEKLKGAGARSMHRGLEAPNQLDHGALLRSVDKEDLVPQTRLLSGVKYNETAAQHVWKHKYIDPDTLDDLNQKFNNDKTPVVDRKIIDFPPRAVTLKPTYWIIKQKGITLVPIWDGNFASVTPDTPAPDTWTTFVGVDPSGKKVGETVTGKIQRSKGKGKVTIDYKAKVVSLHQFYAFQLNTDEIEYLNEANQSGSEFNPIVDTTDGEKSPAAGDYAVLVGMHTTTKEIDNWTWQTFWWVPDWKKDPLANDQTKKVKGVWKNYAMRTAYFMVNPVEYAASQPHIGFNPYLETDLGPEGKVSNCMSCHRGAVWPPDKGDYNFSGYLDPAYKPYFGEATKLDFLWSIEVAVSAKQKKN